MKQLYDTAVITGPLLHAYVLASYVDLISATSVRCNTVSPWLIQGCSPQDELLEHVLHGDG